MHRDQISPPGEAVGSTMLSSDHHRKMKMDGTDSFSFFVHVSFLSFVEEVPAFSSCRLKMNFKFDFIFFNFKAIRDFC